MHKLSILITIFIVLLFTTTARHASARTSANVMENQFFHITDEKFYMPILKATDCESDYKIKVYKKNKKFACFNMVRGETTQPEDDEPFDISAYKH